MRFVWAVAAFVLAALMIGAGIAQRTLFQGPDTETVAVEAEQEAPYLVVDGAVLNRLPGAQSLRAEGTGEIFAAYGRTADVRAWLSDDSYNAVTVDEAGAVSVALVEPEAPEEEAPAATPTPETTATDAPEESEGAAADDAAADAGRDPAGSDLWLEEFVQADELVAPLQLPSEMSVILAADGTAPAPSSVSVSWPISSTTPWAGPLILAGSVVMAVGVLLYILGIRHARRSRGPRRKGLPLQQTQPIDVSDDAEGKGMISSTSRARRALTRGRRVGMALPVIAVSALAVSGCSADAWPQLGASPTPSPSASVIVPEGQQAPAVTAVQAERILARVATTVAQADEDLDIDLAATRLVGAPLAARETNYTLRAEIDDYAAPAAILDGDLSLVLPQASDSWPRSVLTVVDDAETRTSSIMVLTQDDPWSSYKLSYLASLEADTLMPDLAPYYIGATQVAPDSPFLVMPPEQIAAAYSDVINNGEESEFAAMFDAETDQFRASITADRERRLEEFNETASRTGRLTFSSEPGAYDPFAIATLESGAVVAVTINETDTVRPTNEEAVIKLDGNATVRTLAGAEQSATGFTTTFSDQLFFYVPGQGSTEKIRLLGYASDILDAKVIK
ncbi:glycosyl transferase [Microbacterium sp. ARD31]|uniref:glycosyl transferase n=1 Tax=Microbacterium sp. ARD31 TaxID=2962576 RepID=UPI00288138AF|nr:glycosyl transferase [Microbacterium sp. ARD31]MDT0181574.1 glycosyl transferase [Microbacterium sp. ARD31]